MHRLHDAVSGTAQTQFDLSSVPGRTLLVFVSGLLVDGYTVQGSTLTLNQSVTDARVTVYSSAGGTSLPQEYVDGRIDERALTEDVEDGLSLKLDKQGGRVGPLFNDDTPEEDDALVNKAYADSLYTGPTAEELEGLLTGKANASDVTGLLLGYVKKTDVGATSGVAPLDSSGMVPASVLPGGVVTSVWSANSDSQMGALESEVGDFVVRTDAPKRVYIKRDTENDPFSYVPISYKDAVDIEFTPYKGITSSSLQGAIQSLEDRRLTLADVQGAIEGKAEAAALQAHIDATGNVHAVTHAQTNPASAVHTGGSSTDTTRNKHVSNDDVKRWTEHLSVQGNPHGLTHAQTSPAGADPQSADTVKDKHVSNKMIQDLTQSIGGFHAAKHRSVVVNGVQPGEDPLYHYDVGAAPSDSVLIGEIRSLAGYVTPSSNWLFCEGQSVSRTTYAALFAALTFTQTGSTTVNSTTLSGLTSTAGMFVGMALSGTGIPTGATVAEVLSSTSVRISQLATSTGSKIVTFYPYGAGSSSTTFNLPDLRGRTLIDAGAGPNLSNRLVGQPVGSETHTLLRSEMPVHDHSGYTGGMSQNTTHSHDTNAQVGGATNTATTGSGPRAVNAFDASIGSTNIAHVHSIGSDGSGLAHNNVQPSLGVRMIIRALP